MGIFSAEKRSASPIDRRAEQARAQLLRDIDFRFQRLKFPDNSYNDAEVREQLEKLKIAIDSLPRDTKDYVERQAWLDGLSETNKNIGSVESSLKLEIEQFWAKLNKGLGVLSDSIGLTKKELNVTKKSLAEIDLKKLHNNIIAEVKELLAKLPKGNTFVRSGSVVGGGAHEVDKLRDVDVTGLADGDTLVWDAAAKKWKPGAGSGSSETLITNHTTANLVYAMPAATDGAKIKVLLTDSGSIELDANGSEIIQIAGSASSPGGSQTCSEKGGSAILEGFTGIGWYSTAAQTTWIES